MPVPEDAQVWAKARGRGVLEGTPGQGGDDLRGV